MMDGAIGDMGPKFADDVWVAEIWPDSEPTVRRMTDAAQAGARVRVVMSRGDVSVQRFPTEMAAWRWVAQVALGIEYRARLRCRYDRCSCGQEFAGYERTLNGVFDTETKARARALEQCRLVYGNEHMILIEKREVSPWLPASL